MATTEIESDQIRWLTPEEGRARFDEHAHRFMGMSGEEFIRRWDAGEYEEIFDTSGHLHITWLASLLPLGRKNT